MTLLDWILVAAVAVSALRGYDRGLIVGATMLVGFVLGLLAGGRLGQAVVSGGAQSPYGPLFALIGGLAGGMLGGTALQLLGYGLRDRVRSRELGTADGVGGAVLGGGIALALVWVAGSAVLQAPPRDAWREAAQRSVIVRALTAVLPPSGPVLNALARFDPLPRIDGPLVAVQAPRAAIARAPAVQAAARSVVKVQGTACGLGVEGSGWIAPGGIVVTNAHVVAGERDTTVQPAGRGALLPARAIAFDARNDVALLRVAGLTSPALELATAPVAGSSAAILGFPEDGPFDVRAGRIGATTTVLSQDAYGSGPVRRRIVALRGVVRSGNSGGPLVDARGRVVATVFAATRGGARGGYGVPNAVVAGLLARAREPVSTGRCAP